MEEMSIDTPCFRRFAGIETMEGRIPDETTILHFCHLLEEHPIAEQILAGVNQMLQERDPEMHSVAFCQQWFHCWQKASPMECLAP